MAAGRTRRSPAAPPRLSPAETAVAAGAALVALGLLARRAAATVASLPSGAYWRGVPDRLPTVHRPAYPGTHAGRVAFVRDTVAALRGLGLALPAALLFAAHIARETGFGQFVYWFNFGNVKAYDPLRGPYFVLTDRLGFTDRYRAYGSAADGLADDLAFVARNARYATAWSRLQAGDPTWYGALGLAGYYEGPPDPARPGVHTAHTAATIAPVQASYDALHATVRRLYAEGAPAPPADGARAAWLLVAAAAVGGAWWLARRP